MKARPDIFKYHDYTQYLRDWLAYRKAGQSRFSLRTAAKLAGLSPSYLSLVLNGKRHLTSSALTRFMPQLKLSPSERSFLEQLVKLGTSDEQESRLSALERMKKFPSYREANPREFEVHQYLARWYYVAIREMASLADFVPEAEWIQKRLHQKVELKEIREALDFLISNGYLEIDPRGKVHPPQKRIDCLGGVYRLALAQLHRQMLSLAASSVESIPSEERRVVGHGIALDPENFRKACDIIDEAFEKIRSLEPKSGKADRVYFAELALFPLTEKEKK